ncbi:hypothetical protein [Hubei picorna-like virus 30]|uniref:hypothetical protein n=1 Tax=Hubei picorna-like virus 30 TaxID=1923110 RepID=UPI00090A4BF4|nr:hypothetical protein [Hubei picorna-like virus 30]APG78001.1 hypothetical protein [Hubei picorna-like virus 30]
MGDKVRTVADMLNTQYATSVQALNVNSVLTIEIPYYQQSEMSLLAPYSSGPFDNGHIYIWVHSTTKQDVKLEVYYSLADDMNLEVWQGFPAMYDISEINAEPNMDIKGTPEEGECSMSAGNSVAKVVESIEAAGKAAKDISEAKGTIADTAAAVQDTSKRMSSFLETLKSYMDKPRQGLRSFMSSSVAQGKQTSDMNLITLVLEAAKDNASWLFDFISQIVHMVISPTKGTVIWSLINIYKLIFGLSFQGFTMIATLLGKIWSKMKGLTEPPQGIPASPQGPSFEDDPVKEYAGLLYGSIASLCCLKGMKMENMSDIGLGLFKFGLVARSTTFVGQFVSDSFKLLKRVYSRFLSCFGTTSPHAHLIAGVTDVRLQKWLMESTAILNPAVRQQVLLNPDWAMKAFELAVVGRGIQLADNSTAKRVSTPQISQLIRSYNDKLQKLEQSLVNAKMFSAARYEPFCLWVAGTPGCGKTRYLQNVATELAMEMGSSYPIPYHTITAGQKYFDAMKGQPTVFIDDFLTLRPTVDPELFVQFLQMKSTTLFNPPYSMTEDKDRMINFSNLFVTANYEYVKDIPDIHNDGAYNRRRDLLLRFEFKDPNDSEKTKIQEKYSFEQLNTLSHVNVYILTNVFKKELSSEKLIERVPGEEYNVTVGKVIRDAAKRFHDQESKSYGERCDRAIRLINNVKDGSGDLSKYLEMAGKTFEEMKVKLQKAQDSDVQSGSINGFLSEWLDHSKTSSKYNPLIFTETPPEVIDPQPSTSVAPQGKVGGDKEDKTVTASTSSQSGTSGFDVKRYYGTLLNDVDELGLYANAQDKAMIEPVARMCRDSYHPKCAHTFFDLDSTAYTYLVQSKTLMSMSDIQNEKVAYSCRLDYCRDKHGNKIEGCTWLKTCSKFKLYAAKAVASSFSDDATPCDIAAVIDSLDEETRDICEGLMKRTNERLYEKLYCHAPRVCLLVHKARENLTTVGPVVVEKKSWYQRFGKLVGNALLKLLDVLWRFIKMVLLVIASVFVVAGLQYLVSSYFGGEDVEANLHPSGDFKDIKGVKSVATRAVELIKPNTDLKDCTLKSMSDGYVNIKRKLSANVFFITAINPKTKGIIRARCIGLYNHRFIVLKHYIEAFQALGIEEVTVITVNNRLSIKYKLSDILFSWTRQSTGYGMGEFPKSFPIHFSNILKYMPKQQIHDGAYPAQLELVEVFVDERSHVDITGKSIKSPIVVPGTPCSSKWEISQGFEYSWGGEGRCGTLVLAPQMATPLVAIHTAGRGKTTGYGELLFRDTFEDNKETPLEYVEPQLELRDNPVEIKGEYYKVAQVPGQLQVKVAAVSKIIPSDIQGVFPVRTSPAPLSNEYGFDPLMEGVQKRCLKIDEFSPKVVSQAAENLQGKILTTVIPVRSSVGKLSIKESIEGFDIPGYDPIVMSTSEGWPWVKLRPPHYTNKRWLFQLDETSNRVRVTGLNPLLYERLMADEEQRKEGLVPWGAFTCCTKDARILREKLRTPGKTRIFEISPITLTIAMRQYSLDFVAAYTTARTSAENTLGINPDGREWSRLANELLSFSPYILTADYSGYGPRLSTVLLFTWLNIMKEWYRHNGVEDEDFFKSFDSLMHEVAHPPHLVNNLLFRPVCGLPSGECRTAPDNSGVNSLYIRCAFIELAPRGYSIYDFDRLVLVRHNGDDLIISVKEEIKDWFNNETLIEYFGSKGLKMTDAAKSGVVRKWCSLEEATYLKRGFLRHPTREGEWLAPLEMSSIEDTANWIWKSMDNRAASLVNSEMCTRLAYTRGPDYYNQVVRSLCKAWLDKGVHFTAPTWDSLDYAVWEGEGKPLFRFLEDQ